MSPEHGLTYAKDGKPFANEVAATAARTRLGLDPDTHEPVQVEGGWAIKETGGDGASAGPSDPAAEQSDTLKKVLEAKEEYPGFFAEAARALCFINPGLVHKGAPTVMKRSEALIPTEDQAAQMWPTLEAIILANERANKVYEVVFSAKSNPNDPDEVLLTCQGERLVVQREQKVCVPYKFLESAKHATYPVFKKRAGEARKHVGIINCYPFTVIREATMAEFIAQKDAGTKATKEMVERTGGEGNMGA